MSVVKCFILFIRWNVENERTMQSGECCSTWFCLYCLATENRYGFVTCYRIFSLMMVCLQVMFRALWSC